MYDSLCFNAYQACCLQENEVAAVEPPPVILYSPEHRSNVSTHESQPASPVQPEPHQPNLYQPTHPKPEEPYPRQPTNPDPRYQPNPRYPVPTDPRYPSYTERLNQPDGRYSIHTTQERPTYPYSRYPVTTPRRPPVPEIPVHRHTSGPGVRQIRSLNTPLSVQCFILNLNIGLVCTAPPDCPEHPPDWRHAWNPRHRLPVLHPGSGHRNEGNLPGLPVVQTPRSPQHRPQV